MVDFSGLLKKPAFKGVKPQALPPAPAYPGRVGKFELGESKEKKTPYLRYQIHITGWDESVSDQDRVFKDEEGVEHTIDPTKKTLRKDFWLTTGEGGKDGGYYQLDQFLRSIGVAGGPGVQHEDVIGQAVGAMVIVSVGQFLNQQSGDILNEVKDVKGA